MVDDGERKEPRATIPDDLWYGVEAAVESQNPGFDMKMLIAVDGDGNPVDIESPSNALAPSSAARSSQLIKWKCKNGYWYYTQMVGGTPEEFKTTLKCS